MTQDEIIKQILQRNDRLKTDRNIWLTLWEAAMDFVCPQHGTLKSAFNQTKGEKRGNKVYDGTPEWASDIAVSGLYSGLVPDGYKWFKWTVQPIKLNQIPEIKAWLEECEDIAYLAINDSNYGDATYTAFEHQIAFGTAIKYAEYDPRKVLNFTNIALNEAVFAENKYGVVDTLFREFRWSARNAVKEWGINAVPAVIKQAMESGRQDDEFDFLHAIFPREDYDPFKADKKNMPWASYWISLKTGDEKKLLSEGGYRTFPCSVPRMYKMRGEIYGRGPAIKALQAMGVLNAMGLTNLVAGQRIVEPPLQVDDGFTKAVDLSPGALNVFSGTAGSKGIQPIITGLNVPFAIDMQDRQEKAVSRRFHTDVFLALTQADSRMTATEVLERKQEKLQLMGPMIGRQKREHLDSDLDRIFAILQDNGYFPPPPDVLLQYMQEMGTEYTSPLFLAQRKRDSDAILGVYQKAAMIAQATQRLDILDNLDDDESLRIIHDRDNAPAAMLRKKEAVDYVRQARQKQQQQIQAMQAGQAAVEAAKGLSETTMNPEDPNALTEVMKGLGAQ